jgi:photosystem II stability/assembly factor-like uncharacterized protein
MNSKGFLAAGLALFFPCVVHAQMQWWKVQTSGIDTNLRAVSAVYVPDPRANGAPVAVVWASGSNGVILKSLDEGKTWQRLHVADGASLDFRGIVAFSASTAYVMSSGEGEKSRIYKTVDGGETWNLQYTDKHKEFFLDSIACLSETHCFALGDPVDGRFLVLNTADGEHWSPLVANEIPVSLTGEGAFAASNSSLSVCGQEIFFVTAGPVARVFYSKNLVRAWEAAQTPIVHGKTSSGIFSVARSCGRKTSAMVVVGGDYRDPKQASGVAAFSTNGGMTWKLAKRQPGGFRSAVASVDDRAFVAVGPNGEDFSEDGGIHWKQTDSLNLNAVVILDEQHGWAVGPNGTIAVFVNHFQ